MNIHCIGLNHRTAPVEVREKLWFSNEELRAILPELKERWFEECVVLSTCNRTELYYVPRKGNTKSEPLWKVLASYKNVGGIVKEEHFYSLHSLAAANHLFKLASGIDSMILGDIQILNQIKSAFACAQESHTTGTILDRLFTNALHAGKRARTETEISDGAVSAGYAASELVSRIFHDLSSKTALLIGVGETGELTARHLHGHHLGRLLMTNRTRERAEVLQSQLNGIIIDFQSMKTHLHEADIVISSISVPDCILNKSDVEEAMKRRENKPIFILDLGVPRTIDPKVADISNIFLHDIDSLNHIVDRNLERRNGEVPKVQRIILDELIQFEQWWNSRELVPTIKDLKKRFEEIRLWEVERMHAHFSQDVNEEVTELTKRIINKILHTPMVNLREQSRQKEIQKIISQLRLLFGLDGQSVQHARGSTSEGVERQKVSC